MCSASMTNPICVGFSKPAIFSRVEPLPGLVCSQLQTGQEVFLTERAALLAEEGARFDPVELVIQHLCVALGQRQTGCRVPPLGRQLRGGQLAALAGGQAGLHLFEGLQRCAHGQFLRVRSDNHAP